MINFQNWAEKRGLKTKILQLPLVKMEQAFVNQAGNRLIDGAIVNIVRFAFNLMV